MKHVLLMLVFFCTFAKSQEQSATSFSVVYEQYKASLQDGDSANTLGLAKRALTLGEQKFEPGSENLLSLKFNLASAMFEQKLGSDAYGLMAKVVSGFEALKGKQSIEYFDALINRTRFGSKDYFDLDRRERKNIKYLAQEAMELSEVLSAKHPKHAPVFHYEVAKLMGNTGIFDAIPTSAEQYVTKAYEVNQSLLSDVDVKTVELAFILASIKEARNKDSAATKLYESVVSSLTEALKVSHPYELAARARLVNLYEKQDESNRATEHCIAIGEMTPWNDDIEPLPLYRLSPKYPQSKARARREGFVRMTFTIDEMGFVRDAMVVDSEGGSAFEHEAKKALKQWRYAPKFEHGKATRVENRKVQLDFKLGS